MPEGWHYYNTVSRDCEPRPVTIDYTPSSASLWARLNFRFPQSGGAVACGDHLGPRPAIAMVSLGTSTPRPPSAAILTGDKVAVALPGFIYIYFLAPRSQSHSVTDIVKQQQLNCRLYDLFSLFP